MFNWKYDPNIKEPIYVQLSDHLIDMIRSGVLPNGSKLPSERAISINLSISRNTVVAAMNRLRERDVIQSVQRVGMVVKQGQLNETESSAPDWKKLERRGRQSIKEDSFIHSKGYLKDSLHLTRRHIDGEMNFAEYFFKNSAELDLSKITGDGAIDRCGIYPLRESICEHMKTVGVDTHPDEILVCNSITQALNIIMNIFLNIGITYYHEKSSFINLKNILLSSGANFHSLDIDDNGIVVDKINQKLRKPKNSFLHIHSCNHNPTGITTSKDRAIEIVNTCGKWSIPIIEMDSMRGLHYKKEDPSPLKTYDTKGSIIYIGSLLRPTSEVLGIAWIVADKYIINSLSKIKQTVDAHPNLLAQLVADSALRSGLLYEYMGKLRNTLAHQATALNEAMAKYLSDIAVWDSERSSYYIWPEFAPDINIHNAYKWRKGIDFNPGFFYDPKDRSHISFTSLSMGVGKFDEAIKLLRSLLLSTRA